MDDNQAIGLQGFRQHFDYEGYTNNTEYVGKADIKYKVIAVKGSRVYDENLLAIDAIKFPREDPAQFGQQYLDRQIMKAFTGFSTFDSPAKLVTGGWGCGVYNGDFITKIIIQWIAASLAKKDIVICPFGRSKCLQQVNYLNDMKRLTVQQAYHILLKAGSMNQGDRPKDIYDLMLSVMANK